MSHPTPPITPQMREYARQHPNGWLYIADPGYADGDDEVPPEGVVGAYHIGADGEIDEDFHHNENYQPSELAMNVREPGNDLERVLTGIATGLLPESDLLTAVLDAEVLLYATSEEDRTVYTAEMSDGSRLVPACTSAQRVPADWPGFRRVPGPLLPAVIGELDLGLNLHEAVQAVIPNSILTRAAADRS